LEIAPDAGYFGAWWDEAAVQSELVRLDVAYEIAWREDRNSFKPRQPQKMCIAGNDDGCSSSERAFQDAIIVRIVFYRTHAAARFHPLANFQQLREIAIKVALVPADFSCSTLRASLSMSAK
jgi:hypothetical protein